MAMKFVAVLVIILALIASVNADYDEIKGVWRTRTKQASGCNHAIQFLYRNYLAYNLGKTNEGCNSAGVYAGTYAVADYDLYVQYATSPISGLYFQRLTYSVSSNVLQLTVHPSDSSSSSITLTLYKDAGTSLDDVWDASNQYTTMRIQLAGGLYLSYVNSDTGAAAYYGTITPNDGTSLLDTSEVNITYGYADSQSGIAAGTVFTADFEHTTDTITLTMTQPVSQVVSFSARRSATAIDGTWVGSNQGCFQTVEIIKGLFRSYRMQCESEGAAFFGPVDINSTNMDIKYAYSTYAEQIGTSASFLYTLSQDGNTLTLQINGEPFILKKVSSPPNAKLLQLTLAIELSAWTAAVEQAFINALAKALGIANSTITVTAKQAGSLVLTVLIQDDQAAGVTAATSTTTMASLTEVGGYTVQSVVVTGGSTMSSTGGGTGGLSGNSAMATTVVSMTIWLFMAIVAFLNL